MTVIPRIVHHTPRLELRPLEKADRQEFVRVDELSRPFWAPWTPDRELGTTAQEAFRGELRRTTTGSRVGSHLRLGAFTKQRELVGMFALNEIVRGVFSSAFASWQVSADRLRQGYGTEGVRALLEVAFGAAPSGIDLHRVQANVMPSNEASLRIAERVGFRREGLGLRYLKIAGAWEDHVMLAITREERAD